jgi:TolB protein
VVNAVGTSLRHIGGGDNAQWSPDGSRITFVSVERGHSHIAVMNSDGKNIKVLTGGSGYALRRSWSPDGSRIAFQAVSDEAVLLELIEADGTRRTNLADHLMFDMSEGGAPSWSPNGSRLAFTRMPGSLSEVAAKGAQALSFDISTGLARTAPISGG